MGKKQKNNSAYNGAPTDKKETVYKNDTNDEYVYENGQYESAHGGNGYRYGTNRQVSGVHKTLNREAQREYRLWRMPWNMEPQERKMPNNGIGWIPNVSL